MNKIIKPILAAVLGIVINIAGKYIAHSLDLPMWLDMTGTVVAAYYGGLWSAVAAGLANNFIAVSFDITSVFYAIISFCAALIVYNFFIKKGYLNNPVKALISGFWLGLICTILSAPLNIVFYSGYSGNRWGDTLVDMLRWYDCPEIIAVFAGEAIIDIIDKQICVMLAFLIIHAVSRLGKKKPVNTQAAALFLAAAVAFSAISPITAGAETGDIFSDNFVEKIYNNTNGMVASEANVICETDDGYIWIGSYAGLSKFDGKNFEFVREGGLVNVVGMMTDSKGRLWIGTNDAGIARYENGSYTYFTMEDGLPSNSIRCFAEDNEGNVYVGTTDRLCKFSADDSIKISEHDIFFVTAMTVYNNFLVVIDNKGSIFTIDSEKRMTQGIEGNTDYFYSCLARTSEGLLIGTESGELFSADVISGNIVPGRRIDVGAKTISAVFEDNKGNIWLATESGFGYINPNGKYRELNLGGFDSSIRYFHQDYQNNIWIASSNHGVMKLSESSFINAFEKIGAENQVVNAVCSYKGNYFCGTDTGLIVFNEKGLSSEFDELTEMTDGIRVRSLLTDSKDGLWICTYNGLMYYAADGSIRTWNTASDNVTSDRFRCITELTDGTLAIGTADGINLIKDGEITGTLTADDGLGNTQMLSIVEGSDGNVWAGSDGSGIYIISDGKLIKNYTVDDGLSSNIILRIVPYNGQYLIVTSNALCCIDKDGSIRRLESFPYFNNYDIIIKGETAFIPCSAGIYEISLSDLCSDNCSQTKLYTAGEGLFYGLTANSWNHVADDGSLYLCSNNGVVIFDKNNMISESKMKFGIQDFECDDTKIDISDDNTFTVPGNANNISIYASVRNYAFSDVKVRFFIPEFEDNPKTYSWDEIEPIRIHKPDFSDYHVCIQLLDSSGERILHEKTYVIRTETRAWETPEFRNYLRLVCAEIIVVFFISLISIVIFVTRKDELEKLRPELEKKIDEQTSELIRKQQEIRDLYIQTVTALSEAVDAKDRYTSGHSKRVAEYSRMIAAKIGKSKDEQEEIYRAGLLHDIGKIRIPVEIINKESKLTDEEYNIIKIHPVTGYHILQGISGSKLIATAAKFHHERFDGRGYPNGLVGESIPEIARILGIADAYDAMTSNRSYRKALPQDVVRSEIEKCRGTQFDPYFADVMLEMIDEDKEYTMKQADAMQHRILTVDDEPINNKLIAHIMKDEPFYEIVSANSRRGGIEAS